MAILLRTVDPANGTTTDVEVQTLRAGDGLRVAVGQPGCRSSTWRFWANPGKADIYVAARTIAQAQKISLHESGDWHHAWNANANTAGRAPDFPDRFMHQWNRPELPEHGFTRGFTIRIPHAHLDVIENDTDTADKVTYVVDAPPDHLTALHLLIGTPDRGGRLSLNNAAVVGAFALAPNQRHDTMRGVAEVALLLWTIEPWNETHRRAVASGLAGVRERLIADGKTPNDLRAGPAPRMGLFAHDEKGNRGVYDLALNMVNFELAADAQAGAAPIATE